MAPTNELSHGGLAVTMETFAKSLLIALGGALGANARYWLGGLIQSKSGSSFPWETMVINVLGSFVIGGFMELSIKEAWDPRWRLFIAVGLLGGFTTYSSFAYESVNLISEKTYAWAGFYVFGSVLFCIAGAWVGRFVVRMIAGG